VVNEQLEAKRKKATKAAQDVETAKTKGIGELKIRILKSKAKIAKADEGKIDIWYYCFLFEKEDT
jgi:hypothetical protein